MYILAKNHNQTYHHVTPKKYLNANWRTAGASLTWGLVCFRVAVMQVGCMAWYPCCLSKVYGRVLYRSHLFYLCIMAHFVHWLNLNCLPMRCWFAQRHHLTTRNNKAAYNDNNIKVIKVCSHNIYAVLGLCIIVLMHFILSVINIILIFYRCSCLVYSYLHNLNKLLTSGMFSWPCDG